MNNKHHREFPGAPAGGGGGVESWTLNFVGKMTGERNHEWETAIGGKDGKR